MKKFLGAFLSLVMAVPSGAVPTGMGTVKGVVSMTGRGLVGIELTLVNVETGKSFALRSVADGSFETAVPSGSYVFTTPGRSGVSISRAPLSVDVLAGKVASANVELSSLASQDAQAPAGTATITHDAPACILEGEFTLIVAVFQPLASVVTGRLYFQSNLSPEWFYTEFEKIEPALPPFTHRAFIPKVNKDGGIETINYYLHVTTTDFAQTKSPTHTVKVVANESECDGKMAAIGTPDGALAVLSASGAPAGALAGFGGVAGAALGGLAIAGIVALVVAGGVVVKEVVDKGPTPTPAPTPPPVVPPPTPTPTPTPVPLCQVRVTTSPVTPANESVGGRFCTANVTSGGTPVGVAEGDRTFNVPCNGVVVVFANGAAQSSIAGPLPAEWSNDCSGSALGRPCVLVPPLSPGGSLVSLTCATR
jgi:hypothetical protein